MVIYPIIGFACGLTFMCIVQLYKHVYKIMRKTEG